MAALAAGAARAARGRRGRWRNCEEGEASESESEGRGGGASCEVHHRVPRRSPQWGRIVAAAIPAARAGAGRLGFNPRETSTTPPPDTVALRRPVRPRNGKNRSRCDPSPADREILPQRRAYGTAGDGGATIRSPATGSSRTEPAQSAASGIRCRFDGLCLVL